MKKVIIILILMTLLIPNIVMAKEKEKIKVYMFYGDGCPHCHKAMEFFDKIEKEYGKYYDLVTFETWGTFSGRRNKLMQLAAIKMETEKEKLGVPYIIIGDKTFLGYSEEYDEDIKKTIVDQYNNDEYVDMIQPLIDNMTNEFYLSIGSVVVLAIILITNVIIRNKHQKKLA